MIKATTVLAICITLLSSCEVGKKSSTEKKEQEASSSNSQEQLAQYVVATFEDSKGHLWFSTIEKGVVHYDGKKLTYYTVSDGLVGNTITKIVEDKQGNLWLGSHSGLSKYDGKLFTAYKVGDSDAVNRVSTLLIDRHENLWVGTWAGVYRFDGASFIPFELPTSEIEVPSYQATANWVTSIEEDKHGNIWFGRSGYGACKYDPSAEPSASDKSFTCFTKKDGLPSNCVQAICEDKQGNMWFGCRVAENDHPDATMRKGDGGLCRYDGKAFTQYRSVKGLSENDVFSITEDRRGNIWIGANKTGLYRYDGKDFTLYDKTDRADLMPFGYGFQNIFEDSRGNIWLGLSGGLFRLENQLIKNVTQAEPWDGF